MTMQSSLNFAKLWRTYISAVLFLGGVSAIGWAGLHLLKVSEVPECVYLVDEQRQLLESELEDLDLKRLEQMNEYSLSAQLDQDNQFKSSDNQVNELVFEKGMTAGASAQLETSQLRTDFSAFSAQSLGMIIVQIAGAVKKPGVYQISTLQRMGDLIEVAGGLTADADQQALIRQFNLAARLKDEQRIYIPFKQEQELAEWLDQYCKLAMSGSAGSAASGSTTGTSSGTTGATTGSSGSAGTGTSSTGTSSTGTSNSSTGSGSAIPATDGYLSPTGDPTGTGDNDSGLPGTANDCISINLASSEELQTLSGVGPATATLIIEGRPYFNISDLLEVKGIGQATLEKLEPFVCL